MESQPTSADQRCKNRSAKTRPQAASHDKKHRMRTEAAGTEQHTQHQTALSATKSMRPLPDTRDRSNKSTAPTATTEAPCKAPGAPDATWPQAAAANPGGTQTTQLHQRYRTHSTVEHRPTEPGIAIQVLGYSKSEKIIKDAPVAPETPHVHRILHYSCENQKRSITTTAFQHTQRNTMPVQNKTGNCLSAVCT